MGNNELERKGPPPAIRIHGRNLPFDALADCCNVDVRNRRQVGRLTTALKEIRAYYYEEVQDLGMPEGLTSEDWERSLAKAIYARACTYKERFPRVELTPTALATWWHQMVRPSTAGRRKQRPTVEEMTEKAISYQDDLEKLLGIKKEQPHG